MCDTRRICLVGASGLIGSAVISAVIGRKYLRLVGLARREFPLPQAARMEVVIADTHGWVSALSQIKPDILICALGTTRAKVEGDEMAFRAVDVDLALLAAKGAKQAGAKQLILITSVGADALAKSFYLRTKGEIEAAVCQLGFARVDIIQPGLLRGKRYERRILERLAMVFSPLIDLFLHGKYRKYRSVSANSVARAILNLAQEKASGRFIHNHDAILRAAQRGAK